LTFTLTFDSLFSNMLSQIFVSGSHFAKFQVSIPISSKLEAQDTQMTDIQMDRQTECNT